MFGSRALSGVGYFLKSNSFEILCLDFRNLKLDLQAVRVHKGVVMRDNRCLATRYQIVRFKKAAKIDFAKIDLFCYVKALVNVASDESIEIHFFFQKSVLMFAWSDDDGYKNFLCVNTQLLIIQLFESAEQKC